MNQLIEFLVTNERLLFLTIAVISMIISINNVYLTRRKFIETYKSRQKDTEPDIYIYFEKQDVNYYLTIENLGSKPAFNVVCQYDMDFLNFLKKIKNYQQDLRILIEGISYLAPKQKAQIFLANEANLFKITSFGEQMRYKTIITFENKKKKQFSNEHILDIYEITALSKNIKEDPMLAINKTLKETNKELHQIVEKIDRMIKY